MTIAAVLLDELAALWRLLGWHLAIGACILLIVWSDGE